MGRSQLINMTLGCLEAPLIAGCLFYLLCHMKRTIYMRKICYGLVFLLDVVLIILGSYIFRNDAITYIGHSLLAGLMAYFMFHKSKNHIFYSVLYVIMTFFVIAAVVNGFLVWVQYQKIHAGFLAGANMAMVIKFIVLMLFTKLFIILYRGTWWETSSKKTYATLFIPVIISGIIYMTILQIAQVYIEIHGFVFIQLCLVLLICLNLYFIFLLAHVSHNEKIKSELELQQKQSDMQYKYYEALEEKYGQSRKIIHDMRNHLLTLERLYQEGEQLSAKEYGSDLHQMMNSLGQEYFTHHRILNIILNEKSVQAGKNNIRMDVKIGEIKLEEMRNIDITTIFGNLLDNAIEAAQYVVNEGEEAYIHVKADQFHDFHVICISNSMGKKDYGKEKGHKGIGLLNVKNTLDRYQGGMHIEKSDGIFKVNITIPRQEKKKEDLG